MKISNASKKVLASALSAAMVVAFAPTVAFGAKNTNKVTVKYDLGAGIDANAGTQGALDLTQEYTVGGEKTVTFAATKDTSVDSSKTYYAASTEGAAGAVKDTASGIYYAKVATLVDGDIASYFERTDGYTTAGAITLANPAGVKIVSDDPTTPNVVEGYALTGWNVSYDADGDGVAEWTGTANKGAALNVSSENVPAGATLVAKAVYAAPAIASASAAVQQYNNSDAFKCATVDLTAAAGVGSALGTAKFVVTAPDGTKAEKTALSSTSFKAQVGTWTIDLVDGNGTTLDTKKAYIGSLVLTGGVFQSYADENIDVNQQTVYYVAGETETTYGAILGNTSVVAAVNKTAYKVKEDGTKDETAAAIDFYDANGKNTTDLKTIGKKEKGAVTTELTAYFGEVKFASFTAKNGTLTAITNGVPRWIANEATGQAAVKDPATKGVEGYYMVITDAAGKIVAETVDSDGNKTVNNDVTAVSGKVEKTVSDAGTYTATLYKMTAASDTNGSNGVDGVTTAGKVEVVASKTVEVSAIYAAAPTWSYAAKYKADGSVDGGTLTLANAAGDGYDVLLNGVKYDTAKGGQAYTALPSSQVTLQAKAKDSKAEVQASKTVTLVSYNYDSSNSALNKVTAMETTLKTKKVADKAAKYYGSDEGVKTAVAAAKKSITDAGFKEQKADNTEWDADVNAAKQGIVEAVAVVAKAEAAAKYAGTTDANGNLTKLTEESYTKAITAIDQVVADFKVNHDGDKTNNSKASYADDTAYITAIDNAVKNAATTTFKKADVEAAAAVNAMIAALPEADKATAADAEKAEAALKAYGALNATQKQLVASADVAKIAAVQDAAAKAAAAAELKDAQDDAAVSKVKGKTVKAKAKKATKSSLKVVTSKSGAKSTFKKTSGNSKVKVYKSGKIVVKKGLKAGKKYTVKVKATVGASTKTVKVVVKVAK